MQNNSGIILAYKPPGLGSSALVGRLKKGLKVKSAGHAGTLDRFAEGLMILLSDQATPFADIFLHQDKSYEAFFKFGSSTDTHDPSGTVTQSRSPEESSEFIKNNKDKITQAVHSFIHTTTQTPPLYSALKKEGKRFSDHARSGQSELPKERPVSITEAEVLEIDEHNAVLRVRFSVGSGTYIRSIARDLSEMLSFPLHLERLIRTRIGRFSLEKNSDSIWYPDYIQNLDSVKSLDLVRQSDSDDTSGSLISVIRMQNALPEWPVIRITDSTQLKYISHGRSFAITPEDAGQDEYKKFTNLSENENFLLEDVSGDLLAWSVKEGESFKYRKAFFKGTLPSLSEGIKNLK